MKTNFFALFVTLLVLLLGAGARAATIPPQCSGCASSAASGPGSSGTGGYSCSLTIVYATPATPDDTTHNGTCKTLAGGACEGLDCKTTIAWIVHAPNSTSTGQYCEQDVTAGGTLQGQPTCGAASQTDEPDGTGGYMESGSPVVSVDCGKTTRVSATVSNPQGTQQASVSMDLSCSACQ